MAQIPFVTTPHNSGLGDPLASAFEAQQSMNTELYDTVVFEVPGMGLSEANFIKPIGNLMPCEPFESIKI